MYLFTSMQINMPFSPPSFPHFLSLPPSSCSFTLLPFLRYHFLDSSALPDFISPCIKAHSLPHFLPHCLSLPVCLHPWDTCVHFCIYLYWIVYLYGQWLCLCPPKVVTEALCFRVVCPSVLFSGYRDISWTSYFHHKERILLDFGVHIRRSKVVEVFFLN